ncbi:MAG TPA: hypothetical protein VK197_00185 [Verrucomicrobiae bacterium]|nr:hypothetical protein [Verrucomicrobiae bacterium]
MRSAVHLVAVLAVLALLAVACGPAVSVSPSPSATALRSASPTATQTVPARQLSAAEAERLAAGRVRATLDALKTRDGALLAMVAHPAKGVRFSPYHFVNVTRDVVLMQGDLANAYTDPKTRTWGVTDGKGDPITLTFPDFAARYVYSRDFKNAPRTAYNKTIGSGNTIDNTAQVYADAILFEAYDPGPDPANESFRWQCLRLLFEWSGGDWFLVGIVHGEWTI